MSADADRLNIVLAARDREFQRVMDRAIRKMERMERRSRQSMSGTSRNFAMVRTAARRLLPALVALGGISALRSIVADLDNIGKTADRLGLTTEALQELRIAGEAAGVSSQTLDMAMQRFGRRLAEARQGSGEAAGALEEMGIQLVGLDGAARSIEDVLGDVADSMSGLGNQTDRNRIAMRLFDSEGVALVNMLRDGSAGLDEMREAARAAGGVIEDSVIRQAEDAQNELDLMSRVIRADLATALIALAPLLTGATELLSGLARMAGAGIELITRVFDSLPRAQTNATAAAQQFQVAIDNVTLAMGDEMTQSQRMRAIIEQNTVLTLGAARARLQEARGRRAQIALGYEQIRVDMMQSDAYQGALLDRANAEAYMRSKAPAGSDLADVPAQFRDAYAEAEQSLLEALNLQRDLLDMAAEGTAETRAEVAALDAVIASLEDGIDNAVDGMVDLGDGLVVPVELGERLAAIAGGISFDEAEASAARLAEWLGISLETARILTSFGPQGVPGENPGVGGGRGGDPRQQGGGFDDWRNSSALQFIATYRPPREGGGGGGGTSAINEQNDALEEAARIFRETRTEAELYAEELAELNDLFESGAIDQETYGRRMDQLTAQYSRFGELNRTLRSSIIDAAMGGADAFDNLKEAIKRAAIEYLLFGQGMFAGAGGGDFGGLLGALFPNFEGGGDTGNGARTGGLDGKGGFMAMVHPNERVLDLTKSVGTRMGGRLDVPATGGNTVLQVNTVIEDHAGVDVQKSTERVSDGRVMERVMIKTVQDAFGRGEFDQSLRRFGGSPRPIQR